MQKIAGEVLEIERVCAKFREKVVSFLGRAGEKAEGMATREGPGPR